MATKPAYSTFNKYYNILANDTPTNTHERKMQAAIWLATNWNDLDHVERSGWVFERAINSFCATQGDSIKAIVLFAKETGIKPASKQIEEMRELIDTGIPASLAYNMSC